jgi:hypothetical protein
MKKSELSYYRMFCQVELILDKFKNIWESNQIITSYLGLLKNNISIISDSDPEFKGSAVNLTAAKKRTRSALEETAFMLKEFLRMHYTINHKDEEARLLDYPKSKLSRMTDDSFYYAIKHIGEHALMRQQEISVFGIEAEKIQKFGVDLEDWFKIKPNREKIAKSRANHIKMISSKTKETNLLLKRILDPLMLIYKDTATEFYNSYIICRKRDEVAGRKNHYTVWITGIVSDADTKLPVSNVSIVAGKKQKQCLSDQKGNFRIKVYKKDADIIRFSIENYNTLEIAIPKKIIKNEIKIKAAMKSE